MKKTIISLLLVAVLAFGAGFGTLSYYTSTFTSDENSIISAKFDPNDNETFENKFDISGGTFHPDSAISKKYDIDISNIEVAVKYLINVENDGFIFGNDNLVNVTPINIQLTIKDFNNNEQIGEKVFEQNSATDLVKTYVPTSGTTRSEFYLSYIWPESTNGIDDRDYAEKDGEVVFKLEVRQITGDGKLSNYEDGNNFVDLGGETYFNIGGVSGIKFKNLGSNKVTDVKLAFYNSNGDILGIVALNEEGKIITNANTTGIEIISVPCTYSATEGVTNLDLAFWYATQSNTAEIDKNLFKTAWLFTLAGPDAGLYSFTK